MKLDITYKPEYTKEVEVPESFEAIDEETKIGLKVVFGKAFFVGWSSARAQYDGWGFEERKDKLTPKLLISLVDAYKKSKGVS
jgi:hypothetical protein